MNISTLSFIHIDDIRLHAHHGVLPQEQATGNDYTINIRIGYDISRAMQTDDVTDGGAIKTHRTCMWTHSQ